MRLSFRKIVTRGIILLIVTLFGLFTLRFSSFRHISDIYVTPNSSGNASSHRLLMETPRSLKTGEIVNINKSLKDRSVRDRLKNISATTLEDVFISIKTTGKNHRTRMSVMLDTWVSTAKNQSYIFTDEDDDMLIKNFPAGHVINTKCYSDHSRIGLNCKMAREFDLFITLGKRWFCHVDDDNYVNTERLVSMLGNYNHTEDWYLGKPGFDHPMVVKDRSRPGQMLAFWYATGGAGFCISRALTLKMIPHAGGGRLMRAGDRIRRGDDAAIGYIINCLLRTELTVVEEFHSHLEPLAHIRTPQIAEQITFGYLLKNGMHNVMSLRGFSEEKDPTRFRSIHCHLHPLTKTCLDNR